MLFIPARSPDGSPPPLRSPFSTLSKQAARVCEEPHEESFHLVRKMTLSIEMTVRTLDFKIKALDCDAAFIVTAVVSIKLD